MTFFSNHAKIKNYLPAIVLVFISSLLFINTTGGEFTYDDYPLIINNKSIRYFHLTDIWTIGLRPLRTLTFMADYRLFGLDPRGYHVHSILWHAASVLLLYILFLRLTADRGLSFLGAMLFAVHPVHVEAVANIANRKEAICMVFALLSFLFYMNFCERRHKYYGLWLFFSFFSFYLALHAKQVIIVLPLLLVAYEYLFLADEKKFLTKSKRVLFLALSLLSLLALYEISKIGDFFAFMDRQHYRGTFHGYTGDPTLQNIVLTAPKSFIHYVRLLFLPFGLSPAHSIALFSSPGDLEVIISWLFFLTFMALPFLFVRTNRLPAFALFWFIIHYIPVANFIPLAYYVADRYMYIPSAGMCLAMAYTMRQILFGPSMRNGNKKAAALGLLPVICILAFYSIKTVRFNDVWSNRISLWSYDLKINPESYKAYINRGTAYSDLGEYEKAIKDFSAAIRLYPEIYEAYNNRGTVYSDRGAYEKAIRDFSIAINLNPEAEDCYSNRGNAYLYSGNYERAIRDYDKAVELKKDSHRAYYNRGVAYHNLGNTAEAMKNYNKSISLNPDFDRVYNNRGNVLNRLGDLKGAIRDYSRAIELNRQYEMAYFNRAITYLQLKDKANAERDLLAAVRINRGNAGAYYKLGLIYLEKFGIDKARPYFRQAADLGYKKAAEFL
ncbi:MAG: tetratricopeptide repeat protein [Deltaproteobacteria bacterium]|nr:tetratricopeptide repeat protein [Deltaproteobacteria bacterium]